MSSVTFSLASIPLYQEEILKFNGKDTNFKLIIANGKVVSVVSKQYKLIQSRIVFQEFLTSLPIHKIASITLRTNLVKHYMYIRMSEMIENYKLMLIAINSVDKSNALKLLSGIFVLDCGNDMIVMKGIYLKHIGKTLNIPEFSNIIQATKMKLEYLKANPVRLFDVDKKKILSLVSKWGRYKLKEYLKGEVYNAFELYNQVTNCMAKDYKINYFEKLQSVYNLIIQKIEND
jgi:hypothetical protein